LDGDKLAMRGKKRALVLGATGMVGEALARALLNEDWKVHGAARHTDEGKGKQLTRMGVELTRFDVTKDDPAELPEVNALFLEIWDPSRDDLIWPINFYGVGRVVERYAGAATIINGCTINVYGDGPEQPSEDSFCRPTSIYGQSRFAQEKLIDYFCLKSGSKGIHVRYAHANTAKRGRVRTMAEAIQRGASLGPDPDAKIQVISLEDFVRVTIGALEHAACPPTAVNCCHPRVWTMRELAEEIHRRLGEGKVVFDRHSGGIENSAYADATRMLAWFGEPAASLDTILDRVIADIKGT
jgi:nucleoside-diphosphate-sugar epimerase